MTMLSVLILFVLYIVNVSSDCLGEFQQVSTGECTMSPHDGGSKYCPSPGLNKYVCPISKKCVNSVNDYNSCPGISGTYLDTSLTIDDRLNWLIKNLSLDEKYPQLTNGAPEILRLGIPSYNWLNDDIHSVRNNNATVFPNGCGLGATWSKNDLFVTGNIIGIEARGLHAGLVHSGNRGTFNGAGLTAYGPNMNLVRDPRWGRSQEVYSEDPRLSAHMTYHFVTGYQYNGTQNDKYILLASCCKHYAAYDLESQPQSRMTFNAVLDAVNWGETYSPVFRECVVRAKVQHIMCSYNSVNGVPACGSDDILTKVLRDQWGFEGFVVSDYDAMANILNTHHYVNNMAEAVALAIKSGCDQEGGGTSAINQIPTAIKDGLMNETDVDLAFRRLFRTRFMLGFFDPPLDVSYNTITVNYDGGCQGKKHLQIAREIAQDSICLYKNENNALPLNKKEIRGIALIGPQATQGTLLLGNYANDPSKGVTPILNALQNDLLPQNLTINCTVETNIDYYQPGNPSEPANSVQECCALCFERPDCNYWTLYQGLCYFKETDQGRQNSNGRTSGQCLGKNDTSGIVQNSNGCATIQCTDTSGFKAAIDLINNMNGDNNLSAIIVLLGLDQKIESEGHDRSVIELPGNQNELVTQIYNNKKTNNINVPIICVLIHGGTLALGDAATQCDAILDGWYPGQMGGYAIADIIFGTKSPAGRASVTYYLSTKDLPKPGEMNEYGGNGVTYRYYNGNVLYPFGYGLSYTTFKYSNLKTNATNNQVKSCDIIKVTVTVTNTGNVVSDEVIQLYVNQTDATVPKPRIRLADFERTKDLAPGKSIDIDLILTPRYRSVVYNDTSPTFYQPDITIEKGNFIISVGGGQPKYYNGALSQQLTNSDTAKLSDCANQD